MRVMLQSRVSLFRAPGGDTVQVCKTAEYLRARGVVVEINLELEPDLTGYDLVHLFNFTRIQETYLQAVNAKRYGLPAVLSPIYWSFREFERKGYVGLRRLVNRVFGANGIEYLRGLWRLFGDGEQNRATRELLRQGYRQLQLKALGNVDLLLPNAQAEMECLFRDFGAIEIPYRKIPNACDRMFCGPSNRDWGSREYVLCVARIEPRKNQLKLVRALRGLGIPLVLVGQAGSNHSRYYGAVRKAADRSVRFLGYVAHENLHELYANAKVHVLPSWFETPGLASLEAAAAGCNIVVTDRGSTREYFSDYASYCDPTSEESIRWSVLSAWRTQPSDGLRERVCRSFTWEETADETLNAYQLVTHAKSRLAKEVMAEKSVLQN